MAVKICVFPSTMEMGKAAARQIAKKLNSAVSRNGSARLLLSTGASQFETLDALVREDVDWGQVTMFHLDEYVNLPENHPASFRKYLKERFTSRVKLKEAVFVEAEGDVSAHIAELTRRLREAPIDVGVVGIGENAHIAFNDPPADFTTEAAYIVVTLDERCKRQQVREGWFPDVEDVPQKAVSMTVKQILACRSIVSVVPHTVKADAVRRTLLEEVNPTTPATALKTHPDWTLFLDSESAAGFLRL